MPTLTDTQVALLALRVVMIFFIMAWLHTVAVRHVDLKDRFLFEIQVLAMIVLASLVMAITIVTPQ